MCFFPIRHQQPSSVFKPAFAFLDRELAFPEKQQIQCSFQYTALIVDALTSYVPSMTKPRKRSLASLHLAAEDPCMPNHSESKRPCTPATMHACAVGRGWLAKASFWSYSYIYGFICFQLQSVAASSWCLALHQRSLFCPPQSSGKHTAEQSRTIRFSDKAGRHIVLLCLRCCVDWHT